MFNRSDSPFAFMAHRRFVPSLMVILALAALGVAVLILLAFFGIYYVVAHLSWHP